MSVAVAEDGGMWESRSDFQAQGKVRMGFPLSVISPAPPPPASAKVALFLHALLNWANSLRLPCCIRCAASVSLLVLPMRFSVSTVSPGRRYCCGLGSIIQNYV